MLAQFRTASPRFYWVFDRGRATLILTFYLRANGM